MTVADMRSEQQPSKANTVTHVTKVRVDDVDTQFERTVAAGARVLKPSTDHVYDERECTVADPQRPSLTIRRNSARCAARRVRIPNRHALGRPVRVLKCPGQAASDAATPCAQ
ncbi:VOC family protein [Mycobacterium lepromatosis]